MDMIFNWDPQDVCIIFSWWHIRGPISFLLSLLGVAALGISYEYLRTWSDAAILRPLKEKVDDDGKEKETEKKYGFVGKFIRSHRTDAKAVLYGVQVVYSYLIMLVAMTYNVRF